MLTQEMKKIILSSKERGWVSEAQAKRFLSLAGLDVPRFSLARGVEEAIRFAKEINYPIVGKVVSQKIFHKSDINGEEVGIDIERKVRDVHEVGWYRQTAPVSFAKISEAGRSLGMHPSTTATGATAGSWRELAHLDVAPVGFALRRRNVSRRALSL